MSRVPFPISLHRLAATGLLPAEEREHIQHISSLVSSLQGYTTAFESALSLKDWADTQWRELCAKRHAANAASPTGSVVNPMLEGPDPSMPGEPDPGFWVMFRLFPEWKSIAARDATMTVYHFGILVTEIRKQLGLAPALGATDTAALKSAEKCFKDHFTSAERARHAVGHAAENAASPKKIKRHSVDNLFISNVMAGDTLYATFKAQGAAKAQLLLSPLTPETLQRLIEIESTILTAFK